MSSGFLDLAYLIEISIVFNLTYREIKPLFDKRQIKKKTQQITNNQEVKNTIKYCEDNSNKFAEEAVSTSYKKFISSEKTLSKKLKSSRLIKLINFNISIVLCILLFATVYQHIPTIEIAANIFNYVWCALFLILVASVAFPIFSTIFYNRKIKSMYKTLKSDSKTFLDTHSRYLAEKAENHDFQPM